MSPSVPIPVPVPVSVILLLLSLLERIVPLLLLLLPHLILSLLGIISLLLLLLLLSHLVLSLLGVIPLLLLLPCFILTLLKCIPALLVIVVLLLLSLCFILPLLHHTFALLIVIVLLLLLPYFILSLVHHVFTLLVIIALLLMLPGIILLPHFVLTAFKIVPVFLLLLSNISLFLLTAHFILIGSVLLTAFNYVIIISLLGILRFSSFISISPFFVSICYIPVSLLKGISVLPVVFFKISWRKMPVFIFLNPWPENTYRISANLCSARIPGFTKNKRIDSASIPFYFVSFGTGNKYTPAASEIIYDSSIIYDDRIPALRYTVIINPRR